MLLAEWLPPVGTPQRNLAVLIIVLCVVNILMLLLVLTAKYVFYQWLYWKHQEEKARSDKVERLLVASERLLALAGERMERTADAANAVKKGINEMPEKTAEKVVEKIATSESNIVRNPLN